MRMLRTAILLGVILLPRPGDSNPYSVSGANWAPNGVMDKLDMPPECRAYIWDTLQSSNVPNMVRPCSYWLNLGLDHRFQGYHQDTDTIDDPVRFGAWVDDHPGKVWIIGNEPDLAGQDGLSPAQYAAMYHTYHEFIRERDPTARFAVGALSGDAVAGNVDGDIAWWEEVLRIYREEYGESMPVDIWNYHCYAPPYLRNVGTYMRLYVTPFCNWVKRAEDGLYGDAEIWCTEFGIGFWHGPLNRESVAPWMHRLCLRLEESDVDRWFWFMGPWEDPWGETALLDRTRTSPTLLGEVYGGLARGYPNDEVVPMEDPAYGMTPPALFEDSFAETEAPEWISKAGDWHVEDHAYRNTVLGPWWGYYAALPFLYENLEIASDIRIHDAPDDTNWAGYYFRFSVMYGGRSNGGGYLVLLRRNGTVALYTQNDGIVAEVPGAVEDPSVFHRLGVRCMGQPARIRISVDGELMIDWTDPNGRFSSGYVAMESGHSDCSFDNVRVVADPRDDSSLQTY